MELIDITLIWVGLVGLAVIMYVVLDGFDLGVGILYPLLPNEQARDHMMRSVAPVWDGNETWLVLGGAGLLAAFPAIYSIFLPALYIGVFLMLAGLIFRGVAFEFRFKSQRYRHWWNIAFAGGSTVAAAAQGFVVGAYVQGFEVEGFTYVGGAFDWFTPFTLFTALSLVIGYALLGATWGIMKTEGETQKWLYGATPWILGATAVCLFVVSIWTPLTQPTVMERWLEEWQRLWVMPFIGLVSTVLVMWGVVKRSDFMPFFSAIGLFLSAYAGILASKLPYAVPPQITFREAASAPESQLFLLLGILFMLPIVLGYTAWTYWVFRGKVQHSGGYH
ncbi:cytochrome d ubiquinol oxidase subunit II [Halorhodospira halochloris]|uniref:Cytochrome bd2 n=1 Tax=Halorhodospira halochloris TaxID=1052 RepID=A0A0X8X6T8_HALHR|nr:cytochrome d ubiquinol oxidase subunit II [Halorhodospira halochloris]MBK1650856.1 ubiquinol oxidase subunit II [Halorhodospira halochloris]MCG5530295.1 cytochrome d ubiquinol oxidase subunit II [Halorhodospira halochloris]MCG5547210.1 cytochrome d ubiquinol oxidase subunit II [Halorhodospira halochloris]BAU56646.1 putative Cytochrome bd2 [Halorhodospira halochloris]